MFKHTYQGGDCVTVLAPVGSNPLETWKVSGNVQKLYDRDIKGYYFSCEGKGVSRIQLPKSSKANLCLTQPYLVLQLCVTHKPKQKVGAGDKPTRMSATKERRRKRSKTSPSDISDKNANNKPFAFELGINDEKKTRRRLVFTTSLRGKTPITTPLHAQIPLASALRNVEPERWINLILDLPDLVRNSFHANPYESLEFISIGGSCKIRKIFTLRENWLNDHEIFLEKGERQIPILSCDIPHSFGFPDTLSLSPVTYICRFNTVARKCFIPPEPQIEVEANIEEKNEKVDEEKETENIENTTEIPTENVEQNNILLDEDNQNDEIISRDEQEIEEHHHQIQPQEVEEQPKETNIIQPISSNTPTKPKKVESPKSIKSTKKNIKKSSDGNFWNRLSHNSSSHSLDKSKLEEIKKKRDAVRAKRELKKQEQLKSQELLKQQKKQRESSELSISLNRQSHDSTITSPTRKKKTKKYKKKKPREILVSGMVLGNEKDLLSPSPKSPKKKLPIRRKKHHKKKPLSPSHKNIDQVTSIDLHANRKEKVKENEQHFQELMKDHKRTELSGRPNTTSNYKKPKKSPRRKKGTRTPSPVHRKNRVKKPVEHKTRMFMKNQEPQYENRPYSTNPNHLKHEQYNFDRISYNLDNNLDDSIDFASKLNKDQLIKDVMSTDEKLWSEIGKLMDENNEESTNNSVELRDSTGSIPLFQQSLNSNSRMQQSPSSFISNSNSQAFASSMNSEQYNTYHRYQTSQPNQYQHEQFSNNYYQQPQQQFQQPQQQFQQPQQQFQQPQQQFQPPQQQFQQPKQQFQQPQQQFQPPQQQFQPPHKFPNSPYQNTNMRNSSDANHPFRFSNQSIISNQSVASNYQPYPASPSIYPPKTSVNPIKSLLSPTGANRVKNDGSTRSQVLRNQRNTIELLEDEIAQLEASFRNEYGSVDFMQLQHLYTNSDPDLSLSNILEEQNNEINENINLSTSFEQSISKLNEDQGGRVSGNDKLQQFINKSTEEAILRKSKDYVDKLSAIQPWEKDLYKSEELRKSKSKPALNNPVKQRNESNDHRREESSKLDDESDELELVYVEEFDCYMDPVSGKYYKFKDDN